VTRFLVPLHVIGEAFGSLRRDIKRLLPMSLGIVWGMASVMVLLAIARGFESGQRRTLEAFGDRFVLLRMNRAELDRGGGGGKAQLQMDDRDVGRLRRGAPAISRLSPMNSAFRARLTSDMGLEDRAWVQGVLPELTKIRNLPLAEGRFHDEFDEEARRRVIVLGAGACQELFGVEPAVGRFVRVAGFSRIADPPRPPTATVANQTQRGSMPVTSQATLASFSDGGRAVRRSPFVVADPDTDDNSRGEVFEVIGVLEDTEVQHETYVSVRTRAFIPFQTSCAIFDRRFSIIYLEPRSLEDKDLAIQQFREVMGSRYGFGPDDRNAVLVYFDSIERARTIEAVFGGLRLFLTLVGFLILAIGGLGVLNVVLVSVASRRYEIGLRKALGATPATIYLQFFTETAMACVISGVLGFLVGMTGIYLLAWVPLPAGFSHPVLDPQTALLAFGTLAVVAVAVGLYPARVAAALPPVEALRARG